MTLIHFGNFLTQYIIYIFIDLEIEMLLADEYDASFK